MFAIRLLNYSYPSAQGSPVTISKCSQFTYTLFCVWEQNIHLEQSWQPVIWISCVPFNFLCFYLKIIIFLSLSLFKKEEVLTNLCSEEVILTVLPFYERDVSFYVQHLSFLKLNILHHRLLTNLLKSMVDSFTVQQREKRSFSSHACYQLSETITQKP